LNTHLTPKDFATSFFSSASTGNASTARRRAVALTAQLADMSSMGQLTAKAAARHINNISSTHGERLRETFNALTNLVAEATKEDRRPIALLRDAQDYAKDRAQRAVLTLDTLRERGDTFFVHEAEGCPPVLIYDYEVAVDGRTLSRPCNYALLKIKPPAGVTIVRDKRPYIIIHPRAGPDAG